ncbi:fatty-acid peroxygenase [Spinactinospora alkalitolerans]|uniref:Fatty-acid peroxygenase n=1 Tax=Spinactinospora alkalitolerans TaxID=687207 RepID=A0A852TW40_9ACTN|nr:cytochrome P450 [Spinactinospora alkalitolerans]NYE47063.1 fatty-acid peroxygenase [Spinactinospora alkalitolerans]
MGSHRAPLIDSTPYMLAKGYAWLPDRRRRAAGGVVRARVLGQHAVGLCGPEAVRFFYDERHVRRHTAIPEPVRSTLFGNGSVHTLDGEAHRVRKAMFLSLLADPAGIAALVDRTTSAWDEAVASWADRPRVVLFDEASRIVTRGVCRWAGVPLDEADAAPMARDLVAMVDGFATPGPRHWRARWARGRREAGLAGLVEDVRGGAVTAQPGSALDVVARHRDADGEPLHPRVAAVELLNVVRPTVAVCWFVAFAAHALHLWPRHRARLREGGEEGAAYAEAFVQEVRRFYPFAPFIGGRAAADLTWRGEPIPAGALVLLDLYGQNHDAGLWTDPYAFAPQRFLDRPAGRDDLVPQGGGDPHTGHRCPGEGVAVALLQALVLRLARLDYDVPDQDLTISLRRVPARPRSGLVISGVRPPPRPPSAAGPDRSR